MIKLSLIDRRLVTLTMRGFFPRTASVGYNLVLEFGRGALTIRRLFGDPVRRRKAQGERTESEELLREERPGRTEISGSRSSCGGRT